MRLPKTPASQDVLVKRIVPGQTDPITGQWIPESEENTAVIEDASILPKSGRERAAESQTIYQSDYDMYVGKENIIFESGFTKIKRGDVVTDEMGRIFTVVFPGDYKLVYISSLKEIIEG